jgi:FlaA1/EpsC-like NDP-sugar epimerase
MVDDNPTLHSKNVYGYPVLGNFSELERIIKEKKINELIFTHHFGDQTRADILSLASVHHLLVRDFVFVLRDLDERGCCRGIVKPYSVTELDCRNLCSRIEEACAVPMKEEALSGTDGTTPAAD